GINRLWLLPPLMLLWVNLHGGFAIGFLLLFITLAGQGLSRLLKQSGPAVVGVSPYGLSLYTYPLRTVSIGVLQDFIQEWQSPNFHQRNVQLFIALWL